MLQHYVPLLSEMLCFSSCLFKDPPPEYPVSPDWSAHTRLPQHHINTNRAAVQNQFLHAKQATRNKSCKRVVTESDVTKSQNYRRDDLCFRSSVSSGREEILLVQTWGFLKVHVSACSFWVKHLIRRERSSFADFFLCLNKLNKQTLFVVMTE